MKKRLLSLILALVMLLTLASCGDGDKKKEDGKDGALDLSKYQAADGELIDVSSAIFAFFMYDYVGQYSYYLSWYGYDSSLPLSKQTSKCAFDESKTWFEYFSDMTKTTVEQCIAFASAAIKDGMSLSEEDLADLDEYMEQTEEEAYKQGFDGIEGMIAKYYVEGISEAEFRACMELQQLAYIYVEKVLEKIDNTEYTEDDLKQVVEENKSSFYGIDYVHYSFFASYEKDASDEDKTAAYAAAKAKAEAFLSSHSDLQSFKDAIVALENEGEKDPYDADVILSDYVKEHETFELKEDVSDLDKTYYEWAYSPDRKSGDTYIRESEYSDGDKYYTVVYITRPAYLVDYVTKNVRHIFFAVDDSLTGDALQEAAQKVYESAEAVLNTYKGGEMTEEAFSALAVEHSQDGNAADGGIYENVAIGKMVPEFEDWIYDESRKVGDVDIIQTEYGYHIMYFVGDGLAVWQSEALDMHKDQLYLKNTEELVAKYPLTFNDEAINKIP